MSQQATLSRLPSRPANLWRRDVILGAVTGFAVAIGFGAPILSTLGVFWSNVVVPAFYTLAQAGLAYCT
ncbi:MAG TPA: hypothetical protein VMY41_00950 [Thermohalobaculum sp.]|nr:hypothetical protein [Thermohalobaculum sp.]